MANRLRPAPAKLAEILRRIDLLPGEADLPDLSEIDPFTTPVETIHERLYVGLKELPAPFIGHVWSERTNHKPAVVRKAFIGIGPEKSQAKFLAALQQHERRYVRFAETFYAGAIRKAWAEYEFIRRAREDLKRVAAVSQQIREAQRQGNSHYAIDVCWISRSHHLKIMGDGGVYSDKDPLIEALDVDGMDVRRIRLCDICGGVFWAGRDDKKTCSVAERGCHREQRNKKLKEKRRQGYYQ